MEKPKGVSQEVWDLACSSDVPALKEFITGRASQLSDFQQALDCLKQIGQAEAHRAFWANFPKFGNA